MQQSIGRWVAVVALVGALAARAEESETNDTEGVEVSVDAGVLSAYVWRGQVLNDEAVFQPQLNVGWNGLTLHAWGNVDLTDANTEDAPELNEVDLTATYTHQVGAVELTGGYSHYEFPSQVSVSEGEVLINGRPETVTVSDDVPSTGEVFLQASLPDWVVVPTLTVARDIREADGFYASLGAEYSYDLIEETLSLDLSASIGAGDEDYNAFYFGTQEAALNDANAGVALTWTVMDDLTVSPGVQFTMLLDDAIRDAVEADGTDTDIVIGSLSATWEF